jgi:hypothetical protein
VGAFFGAVGKILPSHTVEIGMRRHVTVTEAPVAPKRLTMHNRAGLIPANSHTNSVSTPIKGQPTATDMLVVAYLGFEHLLRPTVEQHFPELKDVKKPKPSE